MKKNKFLKYKVFWQISNQSIIFKNTINVKAFKVNSSNCSLYAYFIYLFNNHFGHVIKVVYIICFDDKFNYIMKEQSLSFVYTFCNYDSFHYTALLKSEKKRFQR